MARVTSSRAASARDGFESAPRLANVPFLFLEGGAKRLGGLVRCPHTVAQLVKRTHPGVQR